MVQNLCRVDIGLLVNVTVYMIGIAGFSQTFKRPKGSRIVLVVELNRCISPIGYTATRSIRTHHFECEDLELLVGLMVLLLEQV